MSKNIFRFSLIYFANKLLTFRYAPENIFMNEIDIFFPHSPQTLKNCCGRRKTPVDFFGPLAWAKFLLWWLQPKDLVCKMLWYYLRQQNWSSTYLTGQFLNSSPPCSARMTLRKTLILSKITWNILSTIILRFSLEDLQTRKMRGRNHCSKREVCIGPSDSIHCSICKL